MKLVRIEAPHFIAGVETKLGRVVKAAPIVGYMVGWDARRFVDYCRTKEWTWRVLLDIPDD